MVTSEPLLLMVHLLTVLKVVVFLLWGCFAVCCLSATAYAGRDQAMTRLLGGHFETNMLGCEMEEGQSHFQS